MIDVKSERLISLTEAGRLLAYTDKPPHPGTVYRWYVIGCGPNRIRLETLKIGGRVVTSQEAVSRFVEALNPGATKSAAKSPSARRRAADRAERELTKMGV